MADERRETELAQAEFERAKGNMSLRTLAYHRQVAVLDHDARPTSIPTVVRCDRQRRYGLSAGDLLAPARRLESLSKKAVREAFDVKLDRCGRRGSPAPIFALAALAERQQAEWERDAAAAREHGVSKANATRARERAQRTRVRLSGGAVVVVVQDAQFVEQSVAAGFTRIGSSTRGATRRYSLFHPIRRLRRAQQAKGGTLNCARVVVQRSAE